MAAVGANVTIRLQPSRRRYAKSMERLIWIINASDQKKYAQGKAFLPIFPVDDPVLQAAVQTVLDRVTLILNPQPVS